MELEQKNYYKDYLQLDQILQAQNPVSQSSEGGQAHDEMLFIVIHQAFELWFRQILFELDFVTGVFRKEHINDNSEDLSLALHRLHRIERILALLHQQVTLLDTMTPLDFLEFRNLLTPASGFQSVQFRLIEARLGLRMDQRHQQGYYKRTNAGGFRKEDFDQINAAENKESLLRLVDSWLARMPFFSDPCWGVPADPDPIAHPFWNSYMELYGKGLTEHESAKIHAFRYAIFNIPLPDTEDDTKENSAMLRSQLSPEAMRSALFIMLYRDFPVFQNSWRILDTLVEIDNQLAAWRHAHYRMVRRMIGMRVGTGNTSGAGYLEGAASSHYIFRDLAGLSTYLIERKKLPRLPDDLIRRLSFHTS